MQCPSLSAVATDALPPEESGSTAIAGPSAAFHGRSLCGHGCTCPSIPGYRAEQQFPPSARARTGTSPRLMEIFCSCIVLLRGPMDFHAEIDELKRRVTDLEGAFNLMSGRVARIHPELQEAKKRNGDGFDKVGHALDRLIARVDTVNTQIWSLRDDLPKLVGEIMVRDGLRCAVARSRTVHTAHDRLEWEGFANADPSPDYALAPIAGMSEFSFQTMPCQCPRINHAGKDSQHPIVS